MLIVVGPIVLVDASLALDKGWLLITSVHHLILDELLVKFYLVDIVHELLLLIRIYCLTNPLEILALCLVQLCVLVPELLVVTALVVVSLLVLVTMVHVKIGRWHLLLIIELYLVLLLNKLLVLELKLLHLLVILVDVIVIVR